MPSSKWTAHAIRNQFVSFFENLNHVNWKSSPVIPHNDNTILFINAGMNQFKPLLLGTADSNSDLAKLTRAVNTQKCIRAGGKHNDLEDVGKDVYHHTFFEMLGNWSFGDYFKSLGIELAWKLLIDVYEIDPERLYVTYFGGDSKIPNCPADTEAREEWKKYLPEWKILPFGAKDNFWEMADVGPCGPCSEIHYDRIGNRDASKLVNADDPDVVEIWNLVFMQFSRELGGILTPLPSPCVDTGMGFERLTSVLQDVRSNYDTDLFAPIFQKIQSTLNFPTPYSGKVGKEDTEFIDMSYRVLADHIRCLSVAIADGADPSNEGRGYVLRRILRRALRYGRQYMNAPDTPWFYHLVDSVAEILGDTFPELKVHSEKVKICIKEEELLFSKALVKGMEHFKKLVSRIPEGNTVFPGSGAFSLYTTYGFPSDLVELMATEMGYTVDMNEFDSLFKEHQRVSEKKSIASNEALPFGTEQMHRLSNSLQVAATNDSFKFDWIEQKSGSEGFAAKLLAIWDGSEFIDSAEEEQVVAFVFDNTIFYAEQGGQRYDTGAAMGKQEAQFGVTNVQKFGDYVLHTGRLQNGSFKVGQECKLFLDFERRLKITQNHTATHLMNFALRKVLGESCDQKGSLVDADRLRFDFQCSRQLDNAELRQVVKKTQSMIEDDMDIYTKEVGTAIGKSIVGLRAVFGENYPDPVRVVSIGIGVDTILESPSKGYGYEYSIEFCGGTHLAKTGEIQNFTITSVESIAKGVRRIIALTGDAATAAAKEVTVCTAEIDELRSMDCNEKQFTEMYNQVKKKLNDAKNLPLVEKKELLEKLDELYRIQLEKGKQQLKDLIKIGKQKGKEIAEKYKGNGQWAIIVQLDELNGEGKAVDAAALSFKEAAPSVPVMVISSDAVKGISIVSIVPDNQAAKMNASEWMTAAVSCVGGRGGGSKVKGVGSSKQKSECIPKAIEEAKRKAVDAGYQTNV